jgi:hypothetical protein
MKSWRMLLIGLLVGLIGFAGVTFEKINGIYTAKPGVTCTTRESFATVLMSDLDRARNMISSSDNEAIKKFIAEKRMTWTKDGVIVIVEQRVEQRDDNIINIKVRPKGETEALWMPAYGVNCEEPEKPNKADKAKKSR